ncbi:MAG: hypothetical protein NXI18_21750 [Alphaproteobacteria bacterium]|nr:hypothetical protein [Alphaproteobacteria bacterium]
MYNLSKYSVETQSKLDLFFKKIIQLKRSVTSESDKNAFNRFKKGLKTIKNNSRASLKEKRKTKAYKKNLAYKKKKKRIYKLKSKLKFTKKKKL